LSDGQTARTASREVAAVLVGPLVRQRREELVQQVAVRGVDLGDLEADPVGADRRVGEGLDDVGDVGLGELLGCRPVAVGDRGGSHGLPAAVGGLDVAVAIPRPLRRRLAAGVGELDAGHRSLASDEVDDAAVVLGLLVGPDAGVGR
jgi:hypothetical protein